MSQFLKYITKKMQGGGDIGSLPGVLSLSAIQKKIKLDKDIKNQKALNAQATLSQYTPKPGDQERMNANKYAYRKDQGKFLNRLADNQHMQAAAKNLPGAAEFALNAMTAGEAGLALNTLAKPALKAAAKYATEKTALKNAYKINPFAFKPNKTAAYRMIGNERGYIDAVESGFLKPGKGSDIGKMHSETHFQMGVPSDKREYFGRTWSRGYDGPYMAEVLNAANDARFSSGPGGRLMGNNVWTYPENYIPTSQAKIYKQDWLKGYKEVPKQTGPPVSYYSHPEITRGPVSNPWDGKGISMDMEGSLDVPEGMMPYIGRVEYVPTTPAEKVYASFFQGKPRPIPPPYKKQKGGTAYVDSVFNAPSNKQIEWVQRLYQKNGKSIMVPGQSEPSTHFMESGNGRVYPTVVTMPDGSLKYLGDGAYDYADSTKTYIQFPTDKQAQWFGKNYKRGTGVLVKKKGGLIVDPRGQWAHPGKNTRIPGDNITMQGVPYPVYGVGSNGQKQMMYPGQDYDFGGAAYVDEYPIMQGGGVYDNILSPASIRSKGIAAARDKVIADNNAVAPVKNTAINFMQGWMNSPMYKSMLQKSAGKQTSSIDAVRKANANMMKSGAGAWKLENLNPDNTFVDDYIYHDRTLGQFNSENNKLSIDTNMDLDQQKEIGVHELSHATDKNILPAADINKMKAYRDSFEKARKEPVLVSDSFFYDYLSDPSETRARLNTLRYQGKEKGIYDPFNQKIDKSKLNLFNSRFSKNMSLRQLRQIYTDDQIVDLLNSVSKNNTQQDMMYAEQGGQMIRRADGSYSRRGLWDNIRANKGSGKKPTEEMLEQERKIKAKEMKNGGTNNPGFEALPEYVQAKILSNMGYGGMTYPFMQKGGEPNGEMALGQMSAVSDKMSKLLKFVRPEDNLDPWIASKLAVMDHSADAIADYMMYGPDAQQQEEEMEQMKGGGYVVTRSNDRKGKTHKVTGPDGSVKYFGDSKLGQHPNDPERKKAFYARHKKNLENNPHFRAFARKTWAEGGELDMMGEGGTNNPGFRALPEYVQQQILSNMAYGGYIGQDGKRHMSSTPTWSGVAGYKMGGMPCYECGGMYAEGGAYDCDDQEKDPVTGKCAADVARGKEAAAANKAASADMNAWAKQVAAMDKANAKQDAAQYAGQMSFDYDWMGSPVDKAEKKAAMAQYKQFFQQNPNTFVPDDTSGFSPEQKYIIASKLKQKTSTPMGSKAFQQKFNQDPRFMDLGRLQSDIVPMMGGWNATRNYLFGNKKYGGPAVGTEMDVTPEQLEALRQQGYEFEII